jgi:hypothetical protein
LRFARSPNGGRAFIFPLREKLHFLRDKSELIL